nr:hypothetical protein [Tanacetum cinerariifolium]
MDVDIFWKDDLDLQLCASSSHGPSTTQGCLFISSLVSNIFSLSSNILIFRSLTLQFEHSVGRDPEDPEEEFGCVESS